MQEMKDRIAIDFIDPLFAVVISISFTEVMKKSWFISPSLLGNATEAFGLGSLILGYLTVILSWVGYHLSIRSKPIKIEMCPGLLRFILDVVLLAAYWLFLVKFDRFLFQLFMLSIIYLMFVVWDQLKWWEYSDEDDRQSKRRRGVSVFWFLVLLVLFLIYWVRGGMGKPPELFDWLFLSLAYSATVLYRFHKSWLHPRWLLDLLSFQLPKPEASS